MGSALTFYDEAYPPLLTLVGAVLLAGVGGWLLEWGMCLLPGRLGRYAVRFSETCHGPFIATLMTFTALIVWPVVDVGQSDVVDPGQQLIVICVISSSAWLGIRGLNLVERFAMTKLRMDTEDNRRIRQLRTQITIIKRVTAAALVVIAIGAILMSFESLRTFGASLVASAGLAGAIAGLAAQTALGNVFAGIQLAFTDALRVDDVVVVEDEWGWVQELTLTSVVIHLWDERRLVMPTTYFTTRPFQNWTRQESRVLGSVLLHVDYATPMDALREETRRVLEANPHWDGQAWVVQVIDTTETTMVVRVLASAHDAPTSWDLRCDIREALLTWLQARHPGALPRVRAHVNGAVPSSGTE